MAATYEDLGINYKPESDTFGNGMVPEEIVQAKSAKARRDMLRKLMDGLIERGLFRVTLAVQERLINGHGDVAMMISEILHGKIRDEMHRPQDSSEHLRQIPMVTLRTVDGRPLTGKGGHLPSGVKIGQMEMDARSLNAARLRGVQTTIYRQYPTAEFTVRADEAFELLYRYGAHCQYSADKWMLIEVGGPYDDSPPPEPTAKISKGRG